MALGLHRWVPTRDERFEPQEDRESHDGDDTPQWIGMVASRPNQPCGGLGINGQQSVLQQKPSADKSAMQTNASPE